MPIPFNQTPIVQAMPGQQVPPQPMLQQPSAPTFYPWPGSQASFSNLQTQNIPQFQQIQQKPVGLPGKLVATQADITPNDVPMDGRVSFFPQQDYSCIIAKAWTADGKIDTVVYVPQQADKSSDEVQNGSNTPSIQDVLNRLQNLEDVIINLPKTPGEDSLKTLLDPLYSKLDTISEKVIALETKPAPSNILLK